MPAVFHAAAAQLAMGGSHLVQLDPVPLVTAISLSAARKAGGTSCDTSCPG